ncbi:hypothetical protein JN11_01679 [Mucilaginibacter frigoritolerans]|uniref:Uncharacterized protein n=1 Tax=Mucilaginibacter frigoritolerans TaxID=652788 RepID=A0A562U6X6_9SPHI|nr:hypothetical protein [Mucilaginibacter frigoritolerans]TWJ01528.1 hypothetical protein JN11_01679 [Mucilaginibacter frigoritolerans]
MKYAYVIGSNAFIVPSKAIFVGEGENERMFLKINSIHHDTNEPVQSFLDIDLDIKDTDGSPVTIVSNKPVTGAPYQIVKKIDSVKVLRSDGSTIIHVHQLDDKAAMGLEHNITAELDVNAPVAVIRLNGDFLVDSLRVNAENEKLYINENGYASSASSGKNKLLFTSNGVVM